MVQLYFFCLLLKIEKILRIRAGPFQYPFIISFQYSMGIKSFFMMNIE